MIQMLLKREDKVKLGQKLNYYEETTKALILDQKKENTKKEWSIEFSQNTAQILKLLG